MAKKEVTSLENFEGRDATPAFAFGSFGKMVSQGTEENALDVSEKKADVQNLVTKQMQKTELKAKVHNNNEETQSNVPAKETKKKAKKPVGRPKLNRETTERRTFTILPSLYNKAMDKARGEGKTLSEVVSALLSEYVENEENA